MEKKQIYLLTTKKADDMYKAAYSEFVDALNEFEMQRQEVSNQGYTCVMNTMYDDETYVKVAKCTKGHSVVRLRLENVPLIK